MLIVENTAPQELDVCATENRARYDRIKTNVLPTLLWAVFYSSFSSVSSLPKPSVSVSSVSSCVSAVTRISSI